MNVADLPMAVFTVLAQMSVGAFLVLGVVQVLARTVGGRSAEQVDRLTDPILYAVGASLVLGFAASALHLGNPINALNVLRNLGSSWLSAEIALGIAFGALGLLFTLLQHFKRGSLALRQALAAVTAVVGLSLVAAMSMIYYSVDIAPAWSTWATPVQFLTTTVLLGALAVGTALMATILVRRRADAAQAAGSEEQAEDLALITTTLKGVAAVSVTMLGVIFLVTPLQLNLLSQGGPAAVESAQVLSGAWFVTRLVLVFLGAGLMGLFIYRFATVTREDPRPLATVVSVAFGLVLVGELIGRTLFYESMTRIGM